MSKGEGDTVHSQAEYQPRRCLACGYDLRGLDEPLRCPECGLVNIPDGLRRQVWEFVDSRKLFFSHPLKPWAKRPPGWWWALDREGDVKRSWGFAFRNVSLMLIGAVLLGAAFDAVKVRTTTSHTLIDLTDPNARAIDYGTDWAVRGVGGIVDSGGEPGESYTIQNWNYRINTTVETEIYKEFTARSFVVGIPFALLAVLIWAVPAWVGLATQIRAGLPSFARAPRTIIAAANYESHRLNFVLIVGIVVVATETLMRILVQPNDYVTYQIVLMSLQLLFISYAVSSWIGPLRSDYTRQLIRSRLHALRIIMMYGVVFSIFIALALYSLPLLFIDWWRGN